MSKTLPKVQGPHEKLVAVLLDAKKPAEMRAKMLIDVITNAGLDPAALQPLLTALMQQAAAPDPSAEVLQLKAQYEQALAELEHGTARPATFIAEADGEMPGPKPRVHIIAPNGEERFPTLHPDVPLEKLAQGMTVYVDPKGAVVLGASKRTPQVGEEVGFLRRLPDTAQIEANVREERVVLYASQKVLDAEESGKLKRGDRLLACPRRQFAFAVIPAETNHEHRFVDRAKLPAVIASRDIGKPHWILGWLIRRTQILLFRPDLLERFDLRPRFSVLLTGPTGTGKTLTIRAFLHEFDQMLRKRTGRDDLGSRVIRVKMSELLSEWLGRSDKNFDELFDDIHALASQQIEIANGERVRLPVTLIIEEGEGMARRRGEYDGAVYDRIVGTVLQRLDDPTDDLGRLPLIMITTSNRPDLFDSAMTRRLAGMQARFTRLDREGAAAVLGKKLKPHYPFACCNGDSPEEVRRELIDQMVAWLFSPNGEDRGLVELTFRDGKKLIKHRRDFLTGAAIEQAVSNAIDQTVFAAAESSQNHAGISAGTLIESLRRHIDTLAENLTAANAADYLDLPEHTQVTHVRRIRNRTGSLAELIANET